MPDPFTTPAINTLELLEIPYKLFRHMGPVASLEQAAAERGQTPQQVVRSILFRLDADHFVMALMAAEEEVLAVTGYRTGAVSPLGLPAPLRILADESVFAPDEISIGSGERGLAIILRSADLRKALPGVELGRFAGKT